jgi:hypothetical protein
MPEFARPALIHIKKGPRARGLSKSLRKERLDDELGGKRGLGPSSPATRTVDGVKAGRVDRSWGTQGSDTIFFTSCNMRCAFSRNEDISTGKDNGEETDPRTLAAMAWTLTPSN